MALKDLLILLGTPTILLFLFRYLVVKLSESKSPNFAGWTVGILAFVFIGFFVLYSYLNLLEAEKQAGFARTAQEEALTNAKEAKGQAAMMEKLQQQLENCESESPE